MLPQSAPVRTIVFLGRTSGSPATSDAAASPTIRIVAEKTGSFRISGNVISRIEAAQNGASVRQDAISLMGAVFGLPARGEQRDNHGEAMLLQATDGVRQRARRRQHVRLYSEADKGESGAPELVHAASSR